MCKPWQIQGFIHIILDLNRATGFGLQPCSFLPGDSDACKTIDNLG